MPLLDVGQLGQHSFYSAHILVSNHPCLLCSPGPPTLPQEPLVSEPELPAPAHPSGGRERVPGISDGFHGGFHEWSRPRWEAAAPAIWGMCFGL